MQQLQATMANKKCLKLVLEATPEANLITPQFWTAKWCTPKSTLVPNEALVDGFEVYTNWRNIWTPCGCKMQHQTATKPGQNNEQKQQTNYAKGIG